MLNVAPEFVPVVVVGGLVVFYAMSRMATKHELQNTPVQVTVPEPTIIHIKPEVADAHTASQAPEKSVFHYPEDHAPEAPVAAVELEPPPCSPAPGATGTYNAAHPSDVVLQHTEALERITVLMRSDPPDEIKAAAKSIIGTVTRAHDRTDAPDKKD